jgi:hypothetical protein
MIEEPVISVHARTVMTNSARYAHYGPGLTKRRLHFGGLAARVSVAYAGEKSAEGVRPAWLFG